MNEIFVPEAKYKEIGDKISCGSIVENNTCKTFFWNNIEYVATGAMGSGYNRGWQFIWCEPVVDLSVYNGELVPLSYGDHFTEVRKGNRDRSYIGMKVKTSGNRVIVFTGPEVEFKKLEVGKQLTIF